MPVKPVPMRSLIPPVTGIGFPGNVHANSYDDSGQFRQRSGSKRRRGDNPESDVESIFNLTRSYPPPVMPTPTRLDLDGVKGLMVEAAGKVKELGPILNDKRTTEQNKACVNTVIALYTLLEAVIEKAVVPIADALQGVGGGDGCNNERTGKNVDDEKIRAALEKAEKTSVIFGANLGSAPVGNRTTLSNNFTAGLRAAAVEIAAAKNGGGANAETLAAETNEAVRVAADALSCAESLDFLGQASRETNNDKDAGFLEKRGIKILKKKFCSMPVVVNFEDRSSRIFFENTLRDKCGIRATMSLPFGIRNELKKFHEEIKGEHAGMIVMTRPDIQSLSLVAFIKQDGCPVWTRLEKTRRLTAACLEQASGRGVGAGSGSG